MQQQNEEIGRNSVKFVRISHCLNIHRNSFTRNSYAIHTKFVRISREFVQFSTKQSKYTSKHTLHSHGRVIAHAPDFAHLGDHHAGAVFARCHSVVDRPGGAMPVMAKWISDYATAVSTLQTSSLCTLPTKNNMHCSPTSMTARSEAGADRERKVRWKGQVGGPAGTDSGGSAKRAWAPSPSHSPTLPTAPFPTQNTLSTLGNSQLDKSPPMSRAGGVQVCGVGLVVFVCTVGCAQVKKSPLQPILGVGEGRQPMVAAGCHHQQHVPPMQLNGVPARLPRLPQGRPRLHRHLVVLWQAKEATQVAPRDVPAFGGEHLGVGGDIGVGKLGPTPHPRHDDAARRHCVEVPNLRDTFGEVAVELLEERPPQPRPQVALALQTPGKLRIRGPIFTPRGVEKHLKIFCGDFFVAAAPSLQNLVPPHLTIWWFRKPPKHNVAVPINKIEGRLGGTNPVQGGVGVANRPMRGVGKGFGAEGGFTRNEGGGGIEAPRYHCKEVVL